MQDGACLLPGMVAITTCGITDTPGPNVFTPAEQAPAPAGAPQPAPAGAPQVCGPAGILALCPSTGLGGTLGPVGAIERVG